MRFLALVLMLPWAGTANAQTPAEAAMDAARQLTAAGSALLDARQSRDRVAALTATVHAYEEGLIAMRDGLRRATIREATLQAELGAKSEEIGRLLAVLQSMGRAPAPLLLLHPSGPKGTARSGMMVADVTPALQAKAEALRTQLEEVALLRQLQDNALGTLQDGLRGAQDARTALSQAISDRTDLPKRFVEDDVQTALLLASTETLEGFASGLTDTFLQGTPTQIAPVEKGALDLPVQGTVLRGFNDEDAAGIKRPGVIIATAPRAMVSTPAAATLLFRGPLLDYGNVVILEPAQDILIVIAGLDVVLGAVGDVLPQGTPIGLMGGQTPSANEILSQSEANTANVSNQTLYLEVREGQSPQDPADWFALID